jgi:hypothetical protein
VLLCVARDPGVRLRDIAGCRDALWRVLAGLAHGDDTFGLAASVARKGDTFPGEVFTCLAAAGARMRARRLAPREAMSLAQQHRACPQVVKLHFQVTQNRQLWTPPLVRRRTPCNRT